MLNNQRGRDSPQVKALAARKDGGQHLFGLRGGEHELHMFRRLLQRLEERVECLLGKHVHLINDVHLVARGGRRVVHRVPQFANLVNAAITRAINLEYIQRATLDNLGATFVVVLEVHRRPIGCIKALGKNTGNGGLARAPWAGKEICMRDAPRSNGIG